MADDDCKELAVNAADYENEAANNEGQEGWGEECCDEEAEVEEIDPDYLFAYGEDESIYCEICMCSASGPKAFDAHLAGARHRKNLKNRELGAPAKSHRGNLPLILMRDGKLVNQKPKCHNALSSFASPLIGMQFVTEWCHVNRHVEPRYYCALCKAKCDVRNLTNHLTAFKHRMSYMKLFYPAIAAEVQEGADKREIAELYSKQIEEEEGRKLPRVKVEGYKQCKGDPDDKELEEYIAANKTNFYDYRLNQSKSKPDSKKSDAKDKSPLPHLAKSSFERSEPFSRLRFQSGNEFGSLYSTSGWNHHQPTKQLQSSIEFDPYQPVRSYYSNNPEYSRQSLPPQSSRYYSEPGICQDLFRSDISWRSPPSSSSSRVGHSSAYSDDYSRRPGNEYSVHPSGYSREARKLGRPYSTERPSQRVPFQDFLHERYDKYSSRYH